MTIYACQFSVPICFAQKLSEERDRLTEDKHEAKLTAARVEADHKQEVQELLHSIQELKQENKELSSGLESHQASMAFERERVS